MKCPRCSLSVADAAPRCAGCGFGLEDLDRLCGALPPRAGCVHDAAGVLEEGDRARLEERLLALGKAAGGELAVVSERSAAPVTAAQRAFWLFNRWGVGGETHAGLLVLLATEDRRVECEVGYAWEPLLGEDETGEVLDALLLPKLREGRYAEALLAGVEALAARVGAAGKEDA